MVSLSNHWQKSPSIYMAAFLMSFYGGIYIVCMPFVIASVGGTDKDLGLCASMGFVSYLMGCIGTGPLLDRFNSRRLAQVGSGVVTISTAALLMIVFLSGRGYNLPNPVMLVIITAMLVESSIVMALFAAIVFAALAFVAVTLAHPPEIKGAQRNSNDNSQVFLGPASFLLVRFRWMSRIALVTVFTCVGLMKTQLALLFTMELGFSKSHFGTVTAIIAVIATSVAL
jgi:MFS family permease